MSRSLRGLSQEGVRGNSRYSDVGRILRLTLLAADIVEAILGGRQPAQMTLLVNPANRLAEGLVRDSHAAARMLAFPPEPTRIGVSIAVSAVPLSHVVETSRLAHHIRRMSRKEPKRSGGSDQNKAIARWDNEGGAPKAPARRSQ